MQRIRRDDRTDQVQTVQQRHEPADLVRLPIDVDLRQDDLLGLVQRGQQVHLGAGRAATAQCLAVDRDHPPTRPGQTRPAQQPAAYGGIEGVGVDASQHPGQSAVVRHPPDTGERVAGGAETVPHHVRQIGCPLDDLHDPAGSRDHRRDRDREQSRQRMDPAARVPRIRNPGQGLQQPRRVLFRQRRHAAQTCGQAADQR